MGDIGDIKVTIEIGGVVIHFTSKDIQSLVDLVKKIFELFQKK